MSQDQWYIYANGQQLGPFAHDQVLQMINSGLVANDAFVYRTGWADWKPLQECRDELQGPEGESTEQNQRVGAPRVNISGRVIVHNNGQLVIGSGVNISRSGIFVHTKDQIFTVGESLKLSVKAEGIDTPFNVTASVIRFNENPQYPIGYGLRFDDLDGRIADQIESLLKSAGRQSNAS